jgi:hypothetical protein
MTRASLIVDNARIRTLDPARPTASAVAEMEQRGWLTMRLVVPLHQEPGIGDATERLRDTALRN